MRRTVTECDRCGETIPDSDRNAARAFVQTVAGDDLVGTSEVPADLCGRCVDALRRFMADPSIADSA